MARSLELLAHRGPDGSGLWRSAADRSPHVVLGHRRLAVIDLSDRAAQPMANDDGSLVIVYNGEVYNYRELASELKQLGHRFRSSSDTEVILRAYEQWGSDCLERLNGMFAFAIWDERNRRLFAARDRFGEKPFYYSWCPEIGLFAFASEIKALLAFSEVDRSIRDDAVFRFAARQEVSKGAETLWEGVQRLPHSHALTLSVCSPDSGQSPKVTRYWAIDLERTASLEKCGMRPSPMNFVRSPGSNPSSPRITTRRDVAFL